MAKVNPKKAVEEAQPKTYFNTEYRFQKVSGLKVGTTRYFIFLKPENNMYRSIVHSVKSKSDTVKFKGNPFPRLICSSYDEYGEKTEELGTCCEMYNHEKERLPERNDSGKRLIDYAKATYILPVLSLNHCLTDPKIKSYEVTDVKLGGSLPAFYEFSRKQWANDILGGLAARLKKADDNTGESIIDPSLEGEELTEVLLKYLSKVVVRVDATDTESNVDYIPKFDFIPFKAKAIAKNSGDYKKIVTWDKNPELADFREEVAEFLTLLEQEESKMYTPWTSDEIKQYIIGDEERRKNIEAYREVIKQEEEEEAQQVVVPEKKTKVASTPIQQKGEIELNEEDVSFSPDEEDFIYEDDDDEDYE